MIAMFSFDALALTPGSVFANTGISLFSLTRIARVVGLIVPLKQVVILLVLSVVISPEKVDPKPRLEVGTGEIGIACRLAMATYRQRFSLYQGWTGVGPGLDM